MKFVEVPFEKLRRRFSEEDFPFSTTDEIEPLREIIGQERALRALQLGLDMESIGYNIFITGFVGTGRKTTIKAYLEKISHKEKTLFDYCYINNFQVPDMPLLLKLSSGQGIKFKKDMLVLRNTIVKTVPQIFDSDEYQDEKKSLIEKYHDMEKEFFHKFEKEVSSKGFSVIQIQAGSYTRPDIAPIIDGKAMPLEQIAVQIASGMPEPKNYNDMQKTYKQLKTKLDKTLKKSRNLGRELQINIDKLNNKYISPMISELVHDLKTQYKKEKISSYLDFVSEFIIENINVFKGSEETVTEKNQMAMLVAGMQEKKDFSAIFNVNVLVDNSERKSVPIIIENYPTFKNLFGTIERTVDSSGMIHTDFTKIKAGSFVRANGGYLVIDAVDALSEQGVWATMKRVLKTRSLEIQSFDPYMVASTSAIKPEQLPIDVKVVMIGDRNLYHILYSKDADFKKIFKVKADFDSTMPLNSDGLWKYAAFIKKITTDEKLLPFSSSAVGEAVEYGIRLADKQSKLSTKFSEIADLIREASYWASMDNSKIVKRKHVEQSQEERRLRLNLIESKIQESIEQGNILISTSGEKIGQINGLAVYNYGDYSFGKPSRITAQVSVGKGGFINIEREAKLSGKIHDKGVLIIAGYFRGKFAQESTLSMSVSICFEQSYSGVDGDSASSTEVYCIISALAKLPIAQGIAVTGSINQFGEIQPIGGVNNKIEGFFDVCKSRGLTGNQGVIIPYQNTDDLMLRKDILLAIQKGNFHIYPIHHVDEGISILTGVPAGKKSKRNTYPRGTVNYLICKKFRKFNRFAQETNKKKAKSEEKNEKN